MEFLWHMGPQRCLFWVQNRLIFLLFARLKGKDEVRDYKGQASTKLSLKLTNGRVTDLLFGTRVLEKPALWTHFGCLRESQL